MEQSIEDKSFQFAVRIVKLCRYLEETKKEYVLSKQIMRSGTAIGANVAESQQAQSRADFISKMSIALKEAVETNYWLRLLQETNYIKMQNFNPFPRIAENWRKFSLRLSKPQNKTDERCQPFKKMSRSDTLTVNAQLSIVSCFGGILCPY